MKILVIDLLNIGDVLFTTPALRALRMAHPDSQIDMLVKHFVTDVVAHNPNLNSIIGMDINGYHKSAGHFMELIRSLRAERYDEVINLHDSARTMLICALCGAKRKVGLASSGYGLLLHETVRQQEDIHRVDSYVHIMRDLGIPAENEYRMEMWIDNASQKRADAMWESAGLAGAPNVIGLNPGASVRMKQWSIEGFARLADMLSREGLSPVFFGGPGDAALVDKIISAMDTKTRTVFTGKLTLLELAAMTPKCSVFVSTDTGPMHIAVTQQVPIVALFGPSDPKLFGPYNVPHVICRMNEDCEGCRTGKLDHTCMEAIPAEVVYDSVKQMLAREPLGSSRS